MTKWSASIFLLIVVLFFFGLSGCSKPAIRTTVLSPPPPSTPTPKSSTGVSKKTERKERPYAVDGKWYFPVGSVAEYTEKGVCSWYGPDFHGKPTSSGEIYDMYGFTAAHRILPFNTQIRVKNPLNNKEILVRINDRGPFVKDRILDLSYAGAKELGLIGPGTAPIEIEALGILEEEEENGQRVTRLVQQVDFRQGDFSIQIGAFKDRQNAMRLKERLGREYSNVEISEAVRLGETFFRVRLIHYPQLQEALRLQKELEGKGFIQAMVVVQ